MDTHYAMKITNQVWNELLLQATFYQLTSKYAFLNGDFYFLIYVLVYSILVYKCLTDWLISKPTNKWIPWKHFSISLSPSFSSNSRRWDFQNDGIVFLRFCLYYANCHNVHVIIIYTQKSGLKWFLIANGH